MPPTSERAVALLEWDKEGLDLTYWYDTEAKLAIAQDQIERLSGLLRQQKLKGKLQLQGGRLHSEGIAGALVLSQPNNEPFEISIVPKHCQPWMDNPQAALAEVQAMDSYCERAKDAWGTKDRFVRPWDVIAHQLLDEFGLRRRNTPLHYRENRISEFAIFGVPDPVSIVLPNADGFSQECDEQLRDSYFWGVVAGAMTRVQSYCSESLGARLGMLLQGIPNSPIRKSSLRPKRLGEWANLYQLSLDILNDRIFSNRRHVVERGSYLYSMEQVWEDFCRAMVSRLVLPHMTVTHDSLLLGWKYDCLSNSNSPKEIRYTPDIQCRKGQSIIKLFDAKYKLPMLPDNTNFCIDSEDRYQTYAACRIAETKCVGLLYPMAVSLRTRFSENPVLCAEERIDGITLQGWLVNPQAVLTGGVVAEVTSFIE